MLREKLENRSRLSIYALKAYEKENQINPKQTEGHDNEIENKNKTDTEPIHQKNQYNWWTSSKTDKE